MNLTRKLSIAFTFVSLLFIYFAWEERSIAFLGFSLTSMLLVFVIRFEGLREIGTTIVSLVLTISTIEFLLSVTSTEENFLGYFDPESDYVLGYSERVDGLGYRLKEGVHSSRKISPHGEEIYNVVYTIGADGYRIDVDDSHFDGYLYGGSFAFGEGLNDHETISYYLNANHGLKIKNIGVHGYGMHQALYNIQFGSISSYNGINILLTSPWHALRSACKKSYSIGTPRYEIVSNKEVSLVGVCGSHYFLDRLASKSSILNLINKAFSNNSNLISDEDIELYLAIIKSINSESKSNSSKLLIAFIDASNEVLKKTRWTNKSLIAELKTISDHVIDVTLAEAREQLPPRYYIHELDQHPSAKANVERARAISEMIFKLMEG